MLFKIGKQCFFSLTSHCSSVLWKQTKKKGKDLRYDISTLGIDPPATLSLRCFSHSLLCRQHFYINCLSTQTQFPGGGLTLRVVPSLRSLAVSGGVLNHAETALVLRLPAPKCFPCARCSHSQTHSRHKTHAAKIPGRTNFDFTGS